MEWFESLILGVIQGLTEFLPVSSSGHLELAKAIHGSSMEAEQSMMMTVILHFATALSTVVVFYKDIKTILAGLFQFSWNEEFQFSLKIIISMIPAALAGVMFDDLIESFFDGKVLFVGFMLIITGFILFLADKAKQTNKSVSYAHAVIIGISQAVAILPGISRSGATIATSVLLGVDRAKAARFSFLMVVPLIFGKIAKDMISNDFSSSGIDIVAVIVGFIAAFLTGMFACKLMIKLVKRSKLIYFSIYCIIIGIIGVFFSM